MPYYRSAQPSTTHYYRGAWTPVQKNAVMRNAANGVHLGMSSPTPSLAQLLGAPVRSTPQMIQDKVLSVMSPEDMVAFKDMMARVQSVLSAEDVQEVMQLLPAPAEPELPDHDAEMATDNWEDDPPGVHPGYDSIDREMAVRAVITWIERPGDFMPEEKGLRMTSLYIASKVLDITVEPCWPGAPSTISAMLSGANQRPPKHYLVSDGRMTYSITPLEIQEYRDQMDEMTMDSPTTSSSSTLGAYNNWLSRSNLQRAVRSHDTPWDPADTITGPSYDDILAEREEEQRLRAVAQQMTIVRNTVAKSLPNKLTGVADPIDVAQTLVDAGVNVEVLQDLAAQHGMGEGLRLANDALQASGSAITLAPAPKMTAVYTPSVTLSTAMDLPEIVAEAKRTLDFTLDNFHYKDSEMSLGLIEMMELVDGFVPNSDEDLFATKQMVIAAVVGVHAVLAVPVAMTTTPSQTPQWGTQQVSFHSTASSSSTLMTNSYLTTAAYGGIAQGPWKGVVEFGEGDAFDREFKLAPSHVYQLPDGAKIEIDATGNYTIHDQDAKITYRANRVREFNRYVNGSDLIGDFIESLGALGASQQQVAKAPIELFIRWLIFKAAEEDHEAPPTDVPPLSSADFAPLATSA